MNIWQQFKQDFTIPSFVAGLIAVIISLTGPVAIIFQAAQAGHLNHDQLSSWIWAFSIGSGISGLILSLRFKAPIICAFSSGGAALLIGALPLYPYSDIIGAYIFSALIICIIGFSKIFNKIMTFIPKAVVSGMLAGILLEFGLHLFGSLKVEPIIVFPTILAYLVVKRNSPRYAVLAALVIGLICAFSLGEMKLSIIQFHLVSPVLTMPSFSLASIIGVGIPLAIVALASQYAPGVAVLQTSGYQHIPPSPLISTTGLISFVMAPFGSHGITLAAITASICTGHESNPNPNKRYIAGIFCGLFYIFFGLFASIVTSLFIAIPPSFVTAMAGLALLGAITNGLSGITHDLKKAEPGLIAFLFTASNISFWGVSSAFWGLVAGVLTHYILFWNKDNARESASL